MHILSCSILGAMRSAKRVRDFFCHLLSGGLAARELFLSCDWMQSMLSFQAYVEINLMFYWPRRKEAALFGSFIAQCPADSGVTQRRQ